MAVRYTGLMYLFQYVADINRSAAFYRSLGFVPGTDEPHVKGFAFGSGYLVIHDDSRETGRGQYQGGTYPAVQVEDVDACHAGFAAAGHQPGEITDWPWGERSFRMDDPDGYSWTFASAASAASAASPASPADGES